MPQIQDQFTEMMLKGRNDNTIYTEVRLDDGNNNSMVLDQIRRQVDELSMSIPGLILK